MRWRDDIVWIVATGVVVVAVGVFLGLVAFALWGPEVVLALH